MPPPINLSAERVRAIRRDYAERRADGRPRYPVREVAKRHGVSLTIVARVARTWGLSRYTSNRG